MIMKFEKIRELYRAGRLTENGLDKAVRLGWITEEEKQLILAENEEVENETE